MALSTPDFVILSLIFFSVLIGIVRGFIKESISLTSWIVAICLVFMYANSLATYITFTKHEFVRLLSAYLIIFVGTVFVGAIINYLVGGFIRKTPFSVPDRVLGSLFGVLRGIVFVTILVLIAGLTPLPQESWWKASTVIPRFQLLAVWLKERLPDEHASLFHLSDEKETYHATGNFQQKANPSAKALNRN